MDPPPFLTHPALLAFSVGLLGLAAYFTLRQFLGFAASYAFRRQPLAKLDPTLAEGVVLLHQFPNSASTGFNLSPFPIKLEMFLRLAQIPYKTTEKDYMSSKGKSPWMELNGVATADSQFCVDRLKAEMGVDLDEGLSSEQKAASRAFLKLIEESLYWILVCSRWLRSADQVARQFPSVPNFVVKFVAVPNLKKQTWAQGMGRHSVSEQWSIFKADVAALSAQLGNNPYFMGTKATEIDCSLFGMLFQFLYHDFENEKHARYLRENCSNLVDYVERIKKDVFERN